MYPPSTPLPSSTPILSSRHFQSFALFENKKVPDLPLPESYFSRSLPSRLEASIKTKTSKREKSQFSSFILRPQRPKKLVNLSCKNIDNSRTLLMETPSSELNPRPHRPAKPPGFATSPLVNPHTKTTPKIPRLDGFRPRKVLNSTACGETNYPLIPSQLNAQFLMRPA